MAMPEDDSAIAQTADVTVLCVEAKWELGVRVTQEHLNAVNAGWPESDESFRSHADEADPTVLVLFFDVVGSDADIDVVVAESHASIEALARRLELPGRLRPIRTIGDTIFCVEERP